MSLDLNKQGVDYLIYTYVDGKIEALELTKAPVEPVINKHLGVHEKLFVSELTPFACKYQLIVSPVLPLKDVAETPPLGDTPAPPSRTELPTDSRGNQGTGIVVEMDSE
jgi:hypothetical protein